jgi:hypothetical protein
MRKQKITQILKKYFKNFIRENNFKLLNGDTVVRVTNNLIQGIYFQPSSYSESVNVTVFIQPLFMPRENIVLSFGERWGVVMRKGDYWIKVGDEIDTMNAVSEILFFIKEYTLNWFNMTKSSCELLENYEKHIESPFFPKDGWNAPYTLGYCALDCGEFDKAKRYFAEMKRIFDEPGFRAKWVDERQREVDELCAHLNDPKKIRKILDENIKFTSDRIGLTTI